MPFGTPVASVSAVQTPVSYTHLDVYKRQGSDPRPVLPDEEEELEARYLHRSAAGDRSGRRIHWCLRLIQSWSYNARCTS